MVVEERRTFNAPQNICYTIFCIRRAINSRLPIANLSPLSANVLKRYEGMITLKLLR